MASSIMKPNYLTSGKLLLYGLILLLNASCGSGSTETEDAPDTIAIEADIPRKPIDYSLIDYQLPKSDYVFKVKITGIETKIAKAAFTTQTDEYAIPKKVDGYFLTVIFAMTNPYDHEMMAPISDYYYITSANGEWFSASTTRHRKCHCDIDNSTEVTTLKGRKLYEISEGKCGYDDYCIKFKPNETKTFKINFTDAIFGGVRQIAFNGFDLEWNNPSYTVAQDRALIIDVDKKKIVGEKRF